MAESAMPVISARAPTASRGELELLVDVDLSNASSVSSALEREIDSVPSHTVVSLDLSGHFLDLMGARAIVAGAEHAADRGCPFYVEGGLPLFAFVLGQLGATELLIPTSKGSVADVDE